MVYVKRTLSALIFVAGLIVLVIIASSVFIPKNNRKGFGMEEVVANGILGEKNNTVDILVLGDSESYASIIPMQIWKKVGYTSYICGTSGQRLDYTNVMLKRSFEKQSPKIVILETNTIYRKQSITNMLFTKVCELLPVFRYHDRWKILEWNDLNKSPEFTWSDDNKGYRYSTVIQPGESTDYMTPTENAAQIPKINRLYVQSIKKFCDENGAKLIFVSIPSTVNWNFMRHNGIQALANELSCEYIDMNLLTKEIPIDWDKDTRDKGDHLNYFGAKKVTAFLIEYLSKTGLLTNHKGDSDYAKWDKALKRFEKVVLRK